MTTEIDLMDPDAMLTILEQNIGRPLTREERLLVLRTAHLVMSDVTAKMPAFLENSLKKALEEVN